MFDRTVVMPGQTRTEFVTREVHEHRAPTDESVKILRDMEDRARKRIVETTVVRDTVFEAVIHTETLMESDQRKFSAVFSINGQKMEVSICVPVGSSDINPMEALRDAVALKIANMALGAFAAVMRR